MSIKTLLNNDPSSVNYGKISKRYLPSGNDPSSITASEVVFTPYPPIRNTNVQSAIQTVYNSGPKVFSLRSDEIFVIPGGTPVIIPLVESINLSDFPSLDYTNIYCTAQLQGVGSPALTQGIVTYYFKFTYDTVNTVYFTDALGNVLDGETGEINETYTGISYQFSNIAMYKFPEIINIEDPNITVELVLTLNDITVDNFELNNVGVFMSFIQSTVPRI